MAVHQKSVSVNVSRRKPVPVFLTKLHKLVFSSDFTAFYWNEEGSAFLVNRDEAPDDLNRVFKSGKYTSFVRQLHFYDFKKIVDIKKYKNHVEEFKHDMFTRDSPNLEGIKRKTSSEFEDKKKTTEEMKEEISKLKEEIASLKKENAELKEKSSSKIDISWSLDIETCNKKRRYCLDQWASDDLSYMYKFPIL